MSERSIANFIERLDAGEFDNYERSVQTDAGWYDWFCRDTSLKNKTAALGKKLKQLVGSDKIDVNKHYVWFKNNCPFHGSLYDDFRIADLETGDVIYTIIPACGHTSEKGEAQVWGRENAFREPIVRGTWNDVKKYFKS